MPRVVGAVCDLDQEHFFEGNALNAVDVLKGRVSIPLFFRQVLERRPSDRLVLAHHAHFPCLIGYDSNHSRILKEEAEKRLGDNPDPVALLEMKVSTFGGGVPVPYDASGRIILPPRLRRRAQITDLALFVGAGGEFMIWSPQAALESESAYLRNLAADALADREAA